MRYALVIAVLVFSVDARADFVTGFVIGQSMGSSSCSCYSTEQENQSLREKVKEQDGVIEGMNRRLIRMQQTILKLEREIRSEDF